MPRTMTDGQHEADDPDPARHRPAAERLRRRGGGRCGRRPPVPPRRRDAGERPRPGLRGPVHARARRPARARRSSSAARTSRRARRCSRRSRATFFGPLPGLGPLRRQRLRTRRRPRPCWRPCAGSTADRSKGVAGRASWPRPARSASASRGCWPGSGAKVAVGSRRLDRARASPNALRQAPAARSRAFAADRRRRLWPRRSKARRSSSRGGRGRDAPARRGLARTCRSSRSLIDLNAVPPWASRESRPPTRAPSATASVRLGSARRRRHQDEDPQEGDPGTLHVQRQGPRRRGGPRAGAILELDRSR